MKKCILSGILLCAILLSACSRANSSQNISDALNNYVPVESSDDIGTEIPKMTISLPKLSEFETLLSNAIIDFYEEAGIDAVAKGYLLKEYEVSDMSGTDAMYEHMISCTYGPNTTVGLTGTANNGKVEYVFTFIPLIGINADGETLAMMALMVMIPIVIFNGKYTNIESLYSLMEEFVQGGESDEDGDSKTLVIDCIEYKLTISNSMVGFTVNAINKSSTTDTTQEPYKNKSDILVNEEEKRESSEKRKEELVDNIKNGAGYSAYEELYSLTTTLDTDDMELFEGEWYREDNSKIKVGIIGNVTMTCYDGYEKAELSGFLMRVSPKAAMLGSNVSDGIGYVLLIYGDVSVEVYSLLAVNGNKKISGTYSVLTPDITDTAQSTGGHTHNYGNWKDDSNGETHSKSCACGEKEIEAHQYNAGVVTKEPTEQAEGNRRYTCEVCGAVKDEKIARLQHTHNYGNWKDDGNGTTHSKSCACEKKEIEAHEYNAGVVTKEPTEQEEGNRRYTCKVCGAVKDENIAKLQYLSPADLLAIYEVKINEYRDALTMGVDEFYEKYDNKNDLSSINAMIVGWIYYGGRINYAIFDIDKNGIGELVLSNCSSIIDVYTVHNGEIVKLFKDCYFGERSRLHILADGRLLAEGSSGAAAGSCEIYRIDTSKGRLTEPLEAYYCDGYGPDPYMTGYKYISQDEYYEKIRAMREETVFEDLEWALVAEIPDPDLEGDTSDYEDNDHAHNYGNWKDDGNGLTHSKNCTCGEKETEAHEYNAGVVTTEPTEQAEGNRRYTCKECGAVKDEKIAKLQHTHGYGEWRDDGNGLTHSKNCACGEKKTEAHEYNAGVVTTEPTEQAEGNRRYTCKECGAIKDEKIAKLQHTHGYGEWRDDGNGSTHSKNCTCGKKETEAHEYDSGLVTQEPTETDYGVVLHTCTKCGSYKTDLIAPPKRDYAAPCICNYCGYDCGFMNLILENGVKTDVIWTCISCGMQNWNYVTMTW